MNEKYKQLIEKIKKMFARKGLEHHVCRATHDWLIILSGATIFTLVFCVVGAYVFFFFRLPPSEGEVLTLPQATFDVEVLENIVNTYSTQAQQFTALKATAPEMLRPSASARETQEAVLTEDETETPTLEEQMQNDDIPFLQ
jgi:hypothetical protein